MKLQQIKAVIAVAELGSIRAAARHLSAAQPVLTRSIRELERELGASIFDRRSNGTVLTAAGALFLDRARSAEAELRRAKDEIGQLHGSVSGTVVAGLSGMTHVKLLPGAISPFRKRYPDVRLRIIEGTFPQMEARLRDGSIDFYVGAAPEGRMGREFKVEHLTDAVRAVHARRGHPLARATSLAQLTGAEWIVPSITHQSSDALKDLFVRNRLPAPRVVVEAQSWITISVSLANSDLLAIIPRDTSRSSMGRETLITIDVKEDLGGPPIVSVKRGSLPLTPAAEFFLDLLRRECRKISK